MGQFLKSLSVSLIRILLWIGGVIFIVWAAGALHFDGPAVRPWVAVGFLAAVAVALVLLRNRRWKIAIPWAAAGLVLLWWSSLQPSNDRVWSPEISRLPYAEVAGDTVTMHNVRNFDYPRGGGQPVELWETRTVHLPDIEGMDLAANYWGSPLVAHPIVIFRIRNAPPLAFSIETRREVGEEYSALAGFFRQYEQIVIAAEERDLLGVRAVQRNGEDVYLYRTTETPVEARQRFMEYVATINGLRNRPRWYNAVTSNCTTAIRSMHRGKMLPFDWRILVNGYGDRMLFEHGYLQADGLPFGALKKNAHANAAILAAWDAPDFSAAIRKNRAGFAGAPAGMVMIPGGKFTMGTDSEQAFPNERPAHRVSVSPFLLDAKPVTNAEFAKFVEATAYVTVAERPIDWEVMKTQVPPGTPKPPDETLQPGSLVFHPTGGPVDLRDMSQWWKWTTGASWRHPEGPGSTVEGRENHPVVQVAFEDAQAYAKWAGKRLPTEAEWEFAARGGLENKRYPWGDEENPGGEFMLNRWTGNFPYRNDGADGFVGVAPAASFPPNGYGLYDMAGNVWNWCSDIYRADTFAARAGNAPACCDPAGPQSAAGETEVLGDPSPALVPGAERRVVKGGSFLCHPDYCESYRPSARRGTPPDTGSSHVGFRCAKDAAPGY